MKINEETPSTLLQKNDTQFPDEGKPKIKEHPKVRNKLHCNSQINHKEGKSVALGT